MSNATKPIQPSKKRSPIFTKLAAPLSTQNSHRMPLRRCSSNTSSPNASSAPSLIIPLSPAEIIIAREIENVVDELIRQAFSREEFLKPLDRFYVAIEQASALCKDFSEKQHFLNTFYEKFFQGFLRGCRRPRTVSSTHRNRLSISW